MKFNYIPFSLFNLAPILIILVWIYYIYKFKNYKKEYFIKNHQVKFDEKPFKKHLYRTLNLDGLYENYNDKTINLTGNKSNLIINGELDMKNFYEIDLDNANKQTSKYDYHLDVAENYLYDDGLKYDMTLDDNICNNTNRYFGDLFKEDNSREKCATNHLLKQNVIYNSRDLEKFTEDVNEAYDTTKIRHIYDKLVDGNYYDPELKDMITADKFYVEGNNGKTLTKERWGYENENVNNGGVINYRKYPVKEVSNSDVFFLTGHHSKVSKSDLSNKYIEEKLYGYDPMIDKNMLLLDEENEVKIYDKINS
jgi:hypothetical protein